MKLTVPTHDGRHFVWYKNTGSCEKSTLGRQMSNRIFSDSADVGFNIKSHLTGRTELFTLVKTQLNTEGEVVYWAFESADMKRDGKVFIRVYND
jgi:hypothetical protein